MTVEVRLATEAEELRLSTEFPALLPPADILTDFYVAVESGKVIGGAAVSVAAARVDPVGPGCWIESYESEIAVEDALLSAVESHALDAGAVALYSIRSCSDDSASHTRWERLGFTAETDAEWLKIIIPDAAQIIRRLLDRRRGWLRDDVEIQLWRRSDDAGVAALHRRCFGGSAEKAARFVAEPKDLEWRRDLSSIAHCDGHVVGASLIGIRTDGRPVLASLAADEAFRKSSVVPRLIRHSCFYGQQQGFETVWVLIGEQGQDVRRFIERLGAIVQERTIYFVKSLRTS